MRNILVGLGLLIASGCAGVPPSKSTTYQTPRPGARIACRYERPTGSAVATRICCPVNEGRPLQAVNRVTYQYYLAEGRGDNPSIYCPMLVNVDR